MIIRIIRPPFTRIPGALCLLRARPPSKSLAPSLEERIVPLLIRAIRVAVCEQAKTTHLGRGSIAMVEVSMPVRSRPFSVASDWLLIGHSVTSEMGRDWDLGVFLPAWFSTV